MTVDAARAPVQVGGGAHPSMGRATVWVVLVSRFVLFAAVQAAIAVALLASGRAAAWSASAAWWPVVAAVVNVASIVLLTLLLRRDGGGWRTLLRIDRSNIRADVFATIVVLAASGVLAMVPNLGLAILLWGDATQPLSVLIQPLPLWAAVVALVVFPATIAFAELPTYFGFVRPMLERMGWSGWAAILATAGFLSLQHATLPLVFEPRFLVWRALMFLPFALFLGAVLRYRPRLLPYLMVGHALIDVSVGVMLLQASLG